MNSFMTFLAQTPVPVEAVTVAAASSGMTPVKYLFGFVYVAVCLFLILAILSRTTKNEGLSGSMMGGSDTSFRGAKSADETIDTITNSVAVAFVVLSIALNYVF